MLTSSTVAVPASITSKVYYHPHQTFLHERKTQHTYKLDTAQTPYRQRKKGKRKEETLRHRKTKILLVIVPRRESIVSFIYSSFGQLRSDRTRTSTRSTSEANPSKRSKVCSISHQRLCGHCGSHVCPSPGTISYKSRSQPVSPLTITRPSRP